MPRWKLLRISIDRRCGFRLRELLKHALHAKLFKFDLFTTGIVEETVNCAIYLVLRSLWYGLGPHESLYILLRVVLQWRSTLVHQLLPILSIFWAHLVVIICRILKEVTLTGSRVLLVLERSHGLSATLQQASLACDSFTVTADLWLSACRRSLQRWSLLLLGHLGERSDWQLLLLALRFSQFRRVLWVISLEWLFRL